MACRREEDDLIEESLEMNSFADLLAAFSAAVVANDGAALGALFTPDGIYADELFGAYHGRTAIAAISRYRPGLPLGLHRAGQRRRDRLRPQTTAGSGGGRRPENRPIWLGRQISLAPPQGSDRRRCQRLFD